ncbi:hypothetical protein F5146DRAFT_1145447 [Armillaria mellea]|nr:hypothetical protein F5146DRAFT_1145447 [Armillaria mellea]
MVNITGKNGSDCSICPPDDVLEKALQEYSAECLPIKKILSRLEVQHGYRIGKTKLNDLNNHFGIMSLQKTDIYNCNGPDSVKTFLAQDGFNIPRDKIHQGLKAHNIHGGAQCAPSKYWQKIHHTPMYSIRVGAEFNCDGHENLSSQALHMGHLVTVLNAHDSNMIDHLYLDVAEENGVISMQITVDKGSETGVMFAYQTALRTNLAPDVDMTAWSPFVALTSINNIIAEALWHWMWKTNTGDIERIIKEGRSNGIFIPASQLHAYIFNLQVYTAAYIYQSFRDLFQWLWSKIV